MDGGGHQHALARRAGTWKDHVRDPAPLRFVQQVVLPPDAPQRKGVGRGQIVEPVRLEAGGVEDAAGLIATGGGLQPPAATHPPDGGDAGAQMDLDSVAYGGLCQGQAVFPGGADGGGGGMERGDDLGAQAGLQGAGGGAVQQLQAGNSIAQAPGIERLQRGALPCVEGDHQGACGPIGNVQLAAQLSGQRGAADVAAGHEGAGLRVIPGMENGGVGLGGAAGHIVLPLQHRYGQPIFGQLIGRCGAGDAAANEDDIEHGGTSHLSKETAADTAGRAMRLSLPFGCGSRTNGCARFSLPVPPCRGIVVAQNTKGKAARACIGRK